MLNVKDYCITTEKLATLQAAITAYAAETPKPRVAVSLRKTYNANLAASFKQADAILRSQMDKMVNARRCADRLCLSVRPQLKNRGYASDLSHSDAVILAVAFEPTEQVRKCPASRQRRVN